MHNLLTQPARLGAHRHFQARTMVVSWPLARPCRGQGRPCRSPRLPCRSAPRACACRGLVAGRVVAWPGRVATQLPAQPPSPLSQYNFFFFFVTQPPSQSSLEYNPGLAALVTIQIVYCDTALFPANCLQYKTFLQYNS